MTSASKFLVPYRAHWLGARLKRALLTKNLAGNAEASDVRHRPRRRYRWLHLYVSLHGLRDIALTPLVRPAALHLGSFVIFRFSKPDHHPESVLPIDNQRIRVFSNSLSLGPQMLRCTLQVLRLELNRVDPLARSLHINTFRTRRRQRLGGFN